MGAHGMHRQRWKTPRPNRQQATRTVDNGVSPLEKMNSWLVGLCGGRTPREAAREPPETAPSRETEEARRKKERIIRFNPHVEVRVKTSALGGGAK